MFQLHDDGPATEELEEDIAAANHWLLPSGLCHIISINATPISALCRTWSCAGIPLSIRIVHAFNWFKHVTNFCKSLIFYFRKCMHLEIVLSVVQIVLKTASRRGEDFIYEFLCSIGNHNQFNSLFHFYYKYLFCRGFSWNLGQLDIRFRCQSPGKC